jgi:hypothetical protein
MLYTNSEDFIVTYTRSYILNGISIPVIPADLMDRLLLIELSPIEGKARRTKRELDDRFRDILPRVLGAIMDALALALEHRKEFKFGELPRLADWYEWAVSVADALGIDKESFFDALGANTDLRHCEIVENDPLCGAVDSFMQMSPKGFEGSATTLFNAITDKVYGYKLADPWFPKSPGALSRRLVKVAKDLEAVCGIRFVRARGNNGSRIIRLFRVPKDAKR